MGLVEGSRAHEAVEEEDKVKTSKDKKPKLDSPFSTRSWNPKPQIDWDAFAWSRNRVQQTWRTD